MKRVMMIGRVSCGKTTLCQRLVGDPLVYKKTQTVEIIGQAIDTPGEYAENRRLMRGLTVSAVDADLIVFLQSCVDGECSFSPGQASMFGAPAVGVVTKTDLAPDDASKARARELLVIVGDDAAIRSMAANDRQQKRYSGLKWRLCHAGDASE